MPKQKRPYKPHEIRAAAARASAFVADYHKQKAAGNPPGAAQALALARATVATYGLKPADVGLNGGET